MNKRKLAKVMNCNISLTINEKTITIEIIKGKLYFNDIMFLSEYTFKYRRRFYYNGVEFLNPYNYTVSKFLYSKFKDKSISLNIENSLIN